MTRTERARWFFSLSKRTSSELPRELVRFAGTAQADAELLAARRKAVGVCSSRRRRRRSGSVEEKVGEATAVRCEEGNARPRVPLRLDLPEIDRGGEEEGF